MSEYIEINMSKMTLEDLQKAVEKLRKEKNSGYQSVVAKNQVAMAEIYLEEGKVSLARENINSAIFYYEKGRKPRELIESTEAAVFEKEVERAEMKEIWLNNEKFEKERSDALEKAKRFIKISAEYKLGKVKKETYTDACYWLEWSINGWNRLIMGLDGRYNTRAKGDYDEY